MIVDKDDVVHGEGDDDEETNTEDMDMSKEETRNPDVLVSTSNVDTNIVNYETPSTSIPKSTSTVPHKDDKEEDFGFGDLTFNPDEEDIADEAIMLGKQYNILKYKMNMIF
ncbi:unnamed protein product [Lactuca virosa]|uniref:Uncharacterized protein n=1 Tax=Lactuca virosa TaxID=75947 RepID=A0AAU9PI59_9ASTR|nr:unnamed protein product [Lactuca virosa]